MIVSYVNDDTGIVTVKLSRSHLRVVQLLLAGKTVEQIVDRINTIAGYGYITSGDVLVMARQFAFGAQPAVGSVEPTVLFNVAPDATVH